MVLTVLFFFAPFCCCAFCVFLFFPPKKVNLAFSCSREGQNQHKMHLSLNMLQKPISRANTYYCRGEGGGDGYSSLSTYILKLLIHRIIFCKMLGFSIFWRMKERNCFVFIKMLDGYDRMVPQTFTWK